jgi:hypothetical protein
MPAAHKLETDSRSGAIKKFPNRKLRPLNKFKINAVAM